MKVLIVDDEEQSHTILNYLFQVNHPTVEVVGSAYTIEQGVQLLQQHKPELVFLDIELPDGAGFDLLQATKYRSFEVVFITAHQNNHYAITAFRFGGLDFLLKPIDPEELQEAMNRYTAKGRAKQSLDQQLEVALESKDHLDANKLPTRILIATTEEVHVCQLEQIIFLEADRNYTTFHFSNGHPNIIASKNLRAFEVQLDLHKHFMRVHKSYIVNLHFVDKYLKGDAQVLLRTGDYVDVSRDKREELIKRLNAL
jgi:two-component system LytT family response regulator